MLLLDEVKDWLKTFDTKIDNYYIGKLDNKRDKSLGIYQLQRNNQPSIALSGLMTTKCTSKAVSLLLHWNKNHHDTELISWNLYKELQKKHKFSIGEHYIYYVELLVNEPVDVHTDEKGVYERVIEIIIYYERRA